MQNPQKSPDPLHEAVSIQDRAAAVGFDWPTIDGVFEKVLEELDEIKTAWADGDREHAKRELGDLLFAAVNLARFLDANPHDELERTNRRFSLRFSMLQAEVERLGLSIDTCTISQLDDIWDGVKKALAESSKKEA